MEQPDPVLDPPVSVPATVPACAPGSPGLLERLSPGAWAIGDQALFAGANFLLNVLLARWLDPATYGALAVGLAVLFLLGAMHVALLGEPLLVFGAGRFAQRRGAYLGAVFIGHWLLAGAVLAVMVLAGGIAWIAGSASLGIALIGLGLCSPFVLLLWLARRVCYLTGHPRRAAVAGAVYLLLMVAGLALLRWLDAVTLPSALLVLGACSAVVSLALAGEMRPAVAGADRLLFREAAAAHLRYGRWSASTNLVIFLSAQAMILLVAALASLEASGLLRAILNLITPMHLVIAAVATLLVPQLARATPAEATRAVTRSAVLLGAAAAIYAILLGLLQTPLFRLVYGEQYKPAAYLVWVLGATLLSAALADVTAAALRARQRPDLVFRSYLLSAVLSVAGGAMLTLWLGLTGAVITLAMSSAAAAVSLWVHARRSAR